MRFFKPLACSLLLSLPAIVHAEPTFTTTPLDPPPEYAGASLIDSTRDDKKLLFIFTEGKQQRIIFGGVLQPLFDELPKGEATEMGFPRKTCISPDGLHLAYVAKVEGGLALVVDGKPGKTFPDMPIGTCAAGPDSKFFAYVAYTVPAKNRRGGKQVIVTVSTDSGHKEQLSPEYDEIDRFYPQFTTDNRLVFIAFANQHAHLMLDGKEIADRPGITGITFSPDMQRLAYTAFDTNDKCQVVVDGRPGPFFNEAGNHIIFSPDSKHVLYAGKSGEQSTLILDGKPLAKKGAIREGDYLLDPAGIPVYTLETDHGFVAEHGAEEFGPYPRILDAPIVSPDGKHIAFLAANQALTERWMVIDGKAGPHLSDFYGNFAFAPNSRYFYTGPTPPGQTIIVDGIAAQYESIVEPHFSADGAHFAYAAKKDGKYVVFLDGQPQSTSHVYFKTLTFTPDNKHVLCVAPAPGKTADATNTDTLFLDNQSLLTADEIAPPTFTPDGQHTITRFRNKTQWQLLIDATPSPAFDTIAYSPVFDSPTHFHHLVQRDKQHLLLETQLNK